MSFSFFNAQSLRNSRQRIYKHIYKCTTCISGISYTILKWKPKGLLFFNFVSMCVQSCLTLCDPMDCSLPDSSVYGIFQAKTLEWVAISFSRGSTRPRDRILYLLCLLHWQDGSLPQHHMGSSKSRECSLKCIGLVLQRYWMPSYWHPIPIH